MVVAGDECHARDMRASRGAGGPDDQAMTSPLRDIRRRELGGPDPLDRRLGRPPQTPLTWLRSLFFTRSALGLAPSLTPAVIFLPLGVLLGPQ